MSLTIAAALSLFPKTLDAEVLLAYVLKVNRSYLYAWPQNKLTAAQEKQFNELINRAQQGEPIPYLVGHQEFWSLDFIVTPDVLIPRPETELLVELVLSASLPSKALVADLGTGSGAIALSLAHERPDWIIHAVDQSAAALKIAYQNAQHLKIQNVNFHLGDWCAALPSLLFDVIVSNPPYIAEDDSHLLHDSIRFEPVNALLAGNQGLDALQHIIDQARAYLKPGGCLMLEHGYNQATKVRDLFKNAGFSEIQSAQDLAAIERVTMGFS